MAAAGNGDSAVFGAADVAVLFGEVEEHLVAERFHAHQTVIVLLGQAQKTGVGILLVVRGRPVVDEVIGENKVIETVAILPDCLNKRLFPVVGDANRADLAFFLHAEEFVQFLVLIAFGHGAPKIDALASEQFQNAVHPFFHLSRLGVQVQGNEDIRVVLQALGHGFELEHSVIVNIEEIDSRLDAILYLSVASSRIVDIRFVQVRAESEP